MVPFGGFHMPVSYSGLSVIASHHFTREHASLFDVSHMVQHYMSGPGAEKFLERVTPMDVRALERGQGGLSVLLNASGGIVDDTIIARLGEGAGEGIGKQKDDEGFYIVTNAGCREKDLKYLAEELEAFKKAGGDDVIWEVLDGRGLIALQGPESEAVLKSLMEEGKGEELRNMYFGSSRSIQLKLENGKLSSPVLVSRGGYTGEDGFEISVSEEETTAVTEALLKGAGPEKLQLAGLGARDSLRLEAGMCLYGHDLDEAITPVEAGLSWVIGKSRRTPESATFNGADKILAQLTPKSKGGAGVERRRVGLGGEGAPAREGAKIVDAEGNEIGNVTSGCPSPTLGKNIAMGYVKDGMHKAGTEVGVVVRGKARKMKIKKMPFVAAKYYKAGETGTAPA
ncbi:glycine cleavage system T protein [Rutstroemia sp. NJR-2017a WRK4]|nr:glycine cleavage system T protein [Rutstroemia sp. NJR-2017a WRK4]PQE14893.1 glycine cleavage system T protein [Rutstroemia sp. NJR-2017a WRK4]